MITTKLNFCNARGNKDLFSLLKLYYIEGSKLLLIFENRTLLWTREGTFTAVSVLVPSMINLQTEDIERFGECQIICFTKLTLQTKICLTGDTICRIDIVSRCFTICQIDIVSRCFEIKNNNCCETKLQKCHLFIT